MSRPCEVCGAPVDPTSYFCDAHRLAPSGLVRLPACYRLDPTGLPHRIGPRGARKLRGRR